MWLPTIVIGVDGGGSHTHALAVGLTGRVLASTRGGGANPFFDRDAGQNLPTTILAAIRAAGCSANDVVGLVAGLAGLDSPADHIAFARTLDDVPVRGEKILLNDAVVAHFGAFTFGAGVLAVAGTGENVIAIDEQQTLFRSSDFNFVPRSSARFIALDAVHRLLRGEAAPADFTREILQRLHVADLPALRIAFVGNERDALFRELAQLAPLVTAAAQAGVPLARATVAGAASDLARGIVLVAGSLRSDPVRFSLTGGAARSDAMRAAVNEELARQPRAFVEVTPRVSPAGGAALLALKRQGVTVDAALVELERGEATP